MNYTISMHNGIKVHLAHNRRDKNVVDKEPHIDQNGEHYSLVDIEPLEAYKQIFGKALDEYNNKIKDKHPERVKTIEQYFNSIWQKRENSRTSKRGVYECIVQIGNKDSRPDDHELMQIYEYYISEWQKRNPNLILIGCYIHFDEPGGPHIHIDYIPVAHCNRGMALQPNMDKAMQEMGYKANSIKDTAQVQWEKAERKALEDICNMIDIGVMPAVGGKKHLEKEVFILTKEKERIEKELMQCNEELDFQKARNEKLEELNNKTYHKYKATQKELDTTQKELNRIKEELIQTKKKMKSVYDEFTDWLKSFSIGDMVLSEIAREQFEKFQNKINDIYNR